MGGAGGLTMPALAVKTASGAYKPRMWAGGNIDFQVTRGLLGLSM